SVEERARPGTTAVIGIECGTGCVCRSLQQQRRQVRAASEEKASPHERQGPGSNPTRSKGPMGKSQGGGKEVVRGLWRPGGTPGPHRERDASFPDVPARLARCAA